MDAETAIRHQAFAELGQDQTLRGKVPEEYLNKMTNYELVEFLIRAGVLNDPRT